MSGYVPGEGEAETEAEGLLELLGDRDGLEEAEGEDISPLPPALKDFEERKFNKFMFHFSIIVILAVADSCITLKAVCFVCPSVPTGTAKSTT